MHERDGAIESNDELTHELGDEHGLGVHGIDEMQAREHEEHTLEEEIAHDEYVTEANLDEIELEAVTMRIARELDGREAAVVVVIERRQRFC